MVEQGGARRSTTKRWLVSYPRAVPVAIFLLIALITLLSVASIERGEDARAAAQLRTRATAVASGLERTIALGRGGPEVAKRLRSIPGIGVWTAAETTQRAHGDADAVSVGDYHLPAVVGWALAGQPVDDDGMLELLSPWAGQRQRIMRLIGASGFRKPRFGPRMTVQDHRHH